ncbi:MAG TPA: type II toxin-antitoxin system RelE/ParE family toxin [Bryobacteraceae bacterium]
MVEQDVPEIADHFVEAVDESVAQLVRMPKMGAPKDLSNDALEGLRSWPVQGFDDIRIYYLVQRDTLKVIRILHGKRDINRILSAEPGEDTLH